MAKERLAGMEKKAKRKIVYRKKSQNRASMLLAITVMSVIFLAVMIRGFSLRQKLHEYDEKKTQLQDEIASEQERSEQLEQYSKYTQTDEYVEEVARDKLGLVKEGETVFRKDGNADTSAADSSTSSIEEGGQASSGESTQEQTNLSGQDPEGQSAQIASGTASAEAGAASENGE